MVSLAKNFLLLKLFKAKRMTSTAQRLWETAHTLPEPLLAEVLDFADFLRARISIAPAPVPDTPLSALCGCLTESGTFADSPVNIQERLRDEWH